MKINTATLSNDMGLEKAFLESWVDWEQPFDFVLQFCGCKLRKDVFSADIVENCDVLAISLDEGVVEVYHRDNQDGVPYRSFKFNIVLEK